MERKAISVHSVFVARSPLWEVQNPTVTSLLKKKFKRILMKVAFALPTSFRRAIRSRLPGVRRQMGSVELRMNLFHLASQVLEYSVPGDFAEVGCNAGESSVVLQRILQDRDPSRALHVFDSFQGVPDTDSRDEGAYSRGDMANTKAELVSNFNAMRLPLPVIHEGWFEETLPKGLPDSIAFGFIDGDLYSSTLTALKEVYPRLAPNAICMLGVYCDPSVYEPRSRSLRYRSPGVKKACDEFFADKPEVISVLYSGDYTSAYFRKQ